MVIIQRQLPLTACFYFPPLSQRIPKSAFETPCTDLEYLPILHAGKVSAFVVSLRLP